MRVLLIDDDNDGRNGTLRVLADASATKYDVCIADTYCGSLELITRNIYDLCLVDSRIGMPEQNGVKFIRQARDAGCTAALILLVRNTAEQKMPELSEASDIQRLIKNKFTIKKLENTLLNMRDQENEIIQSRSANAVHNHIVQDQTEQIQLLESKIRELSDRAKELSGLKSRLLMMAIHEFRTPLTTIYSSAELISRYTKTDEQANRVRHVGRIKSCIEKFLLTLDDFRMLDESGADKVVVQQEPLNVFSLCKQVIREVEESHNAQLIRYSHVSSTAIAFMDSRLLSFIVRQLLLNAIKFSYGKHVVVFVTSINNALFEIKISDKGIGIPADEQQYLFEPFFRASNAQNIPGTGIGLSLVATYAKKMNGRITIESAKDEGTVIKLTFSGIHSA